MLGGAYTYNIIAQYWRFCILDDFFYLLLCVNTHSYNKALFSLRNQFVDTYFQISMSENIESSYG